MASAVRTARSLTAAAGLRQVFFRAWRGRGGAAQGLGPPGQLAVKERQEQYGGGDADEDERHVVQPGVADAGVEDDAGDRRRGDRPDVAEGPREARGGPETFRRCLQ